jgi:hypothetical protein
MSAQTGSLKVALTAATGTTAGGVLKLENPEGVDLLITRFVLNVTTKSTGAATVDAGVNSDGSASNDTLIDGLSVATAGVYDNLGSGGSNGKAIVRWPAGHFVVVTASATTAGMVGDAHIQYVRA